MTDKNRTVGQISAAAKTREQQPDCDEFTSEYSGPELVEGCRFEVRTYETLNPEPLNLET